MSQSVIVGAQAATTRYCEGLQGSGVPVSPAVEVPSAADRDHRAELRYRRALRDVEDPGLATDFPLRHPGEPRWIRAPHPEFVQSELPEGGAGHLQDHAAAGADDFPGKVTTYSEVVQAYELGKELIHCLAGVMRR